MEEIVTTKQSHTLVEQPRQVDRTHWGSFDDTCESFYILDPIDLSDKFVAYSDVPIPNTLISKQNYTGVNYQPTRHLSTLSSSVLLPFSDPSHSPSISVSCLSLNNSDSNLKIESNYQFISKHDPTTELPQTP
ncbi:hypothetical protein NADFUDRAFT_77611, partial [Nadsonia fulvescens var. elongata DSM 6958]